MPSAIEYGMSITDFWEKDPELFWAYRFSYINKLKRESELNNYNAWLQGLYFFDGLSIALANSFGKSNFKYPTEPYGMELQKEEKPKMTEQEKTVIELKGRVAQVQALWKQKEKGKNKKSSTTEKRETEVVKINGKD